MFIRWQTRKRSSSQFGSKYDENGKRRKDTHHAAILVASARLGGNPVQRHIAYLGGITDSGIAILHQRCFFWDGITAAFDKLGGKVSAADRKRFETAIAAKVPRPSKKEYKAAARESAQNIGWKYLTEEFKAALADEADKWQDHEGDAAIGEPTEPAEGTVCLFCGKTSEQVQVMVTSGVAAAAAICDACIAEATTIVAHRVK